MLPIQFAVMDFELYAFQFRRTEEQTKQCPGMRHLGSKIPRHTMRLNIFLFRE